MDAVREVKVPDELEGAKLKEIERWAKETLGVEADLSRGDLREIRDGQVKRVELRPKRTGFFTEDGEFVEASDHSLAFGDDIEETEDLLEKERQDRQWVDEETERFNKEGVDEDSGIRPHWEHGKRTVDYLQRSGRPEFRIHTMLSERGGIEGYGRRTHEFCTKLYRWRPEADPEDPIFGWTWQLTDAVLEFSERDDVRDAIEQLVNERLLDASIPMRSIAEFLRGPNQDASDLWEKHPKELKPIYRTLREGNDLSNEQQETLIELLS